jgi:hypothetical protein
MPLSFVNSILAAITYLSCGLLSGAAKVARSKDRYMEAPILGARGIDPKHAGTIPQVFYPN